MLAIVSHRGCLKDLAAEAHLCGSVDEHAEIRVHALAAAIFPCGGAGR